MEGFLGVLTDLAGQLMGSKEKKAPLAPIQSASEQGIDEKKIVEFVKSKIDLSRQSNSRIAIENIYMTNVAYLMGFDGVFYDSSYRQFKNIDPKRKLTRNRFRVNKILPTIQNRLARLCQSPPRFDVRPQSNSSEDKDSARLGLEIIKDILDKQHFDEKKQDLLMSAMQGGHAYIQVHWDPTLGKPMIDPDTEELIGYEGDIRLEVLNCLEVIPDPLAKSVDDAQCLIKAKVRKLQYFKEKYPDRGDAVKEENAWLLSSLYDLKSNALTSVGIVGANTTEQQNNSAIELVYYEKRSKEHPNGRMIVIASGILLEDKELPIGEFDIVKFDDIMIGGRYNSEAIITHLRPIQDQYNITRTKMADWIRKLLAGKYLAPKGAGLSQEAIDSESGEVVEYNPVPNALPPTAMQIPAIPQYAYKDLEELDKEFDFVSGINEVSRGVLPSASIPAAGMAFLQEQDQTRIGVSTSRNEVGFAKIGSCILKYVGKYYEMPRVLKLAGDGLEYTVKEFMGKDLRDNFDVIVIPGSTIPQSKVLRRQDILNAYQMGLLGDPQDQKLRAKVLSMLEYGDTAEMWKDQALNEAQVKRLLSAIEAGDEEAVSKNLNEFDDHIFRLVKLNEFRKGDKFQDLDPEKQKLLMYVMEWELQAQNNLMNPGLAQQATQAELMIKNIKNNALTGQVPPPAPMDMQGNPTAPPMQQAPVPNATQQIQ